MKVSSLSLSRTLVDLTFSRCCIMLPFWVSFDSRKNLVMVATVSHGKVVILPLLMTLRKVALEGNPNTALLWYQQIASTAATYLFWKLWHWSKDRVTMRTGFLIKLCLFPYSFKWLTLKNWWTWDWPVRKWLTCQKNFGIDFNYLYSLFTCYFWLFLRKWF